MPPREWMHGYNIRFYYNYTLKDRLKNKNLPIPRHWINDDKMTIFDKACFGIIPDIGKHKPDERDEEGRTVAMLLSLNGIIPPK